MTNRKTPTQATQIRNLKRELAKVQKDFKQAADNVDLWIYRYSEVRREFISLKEKRAEQSEPIIAELKEKNSDLESRLDRLSTAYDKEWRKTQKWKKAFKRVAKAL